ncbi:circadian clock-controlled protein daywake isoform X1 [Zeugodacus cucurbitae]|uniref:circadian clock-controlled protein daywake isoform X1 n=1 Tax=Zeugodacus cucurbitae TaxID=28588 RepID=UPI0023D8F817|nr:circadian clock-controlled protein daywake isoform X1 [Zeugodacus cucurbitae]
MGLNTIYESNQKQVLLILSAVLSIQSCVFAFEFPEPITRCHFADEKCMIEQAHKLFEKAATGVPERDIPALEPMKLDKIEMLGDKNSALKIDLIMNDVEIHNYTKARVISIKGFSKNLSKPMKLVSQNINPRITIKSKYKINGNILVLPIRGEGELTMVLDNVKTRFSTTLKVEKRDGKHFLSGDTIKLETQMDNVHIDMTNLFNGDKTLSESMLQVMNENWRLLSDDLTPIINKALGNKVKELLQKFFKDIPYEDYFLTD